MTNESLVPGHMISKGQLKTYLYMFLAQYFSDNYELLFLQQM